jgi:hypothetical protein
MGRSLLSRSGTIAIATAVALPAIPALTSRYGFSDDYSFLGYEQSAGELLREVAGAHQRPLAGLIWVLSRELVGNIDALGWVRLVALAGAIALALAMRASAWSAGFSERFALTLAIGVGLLPSVQLYVAWAAGVPCIWASAASIVASQQLVSSGASVSLTLRIRVVALLLASGLTYQPAVGFFVVGLVLALLSPQPRHEPRRLLERHASALAMAVAGVLVWIVVARIAINDDYRTTIAQHPGRKVSWFSTEVLNNATNTFDITPSHVVEVLVLAVIAALVAVIARKQGLFVAFVLVAALPITYAPNLIVEETWAAYRTLAALSALVLVFVLVAARELAQFVATTVSRQSTRRRLDGGVTLALVGLGVIASVVVTTTMHDDLVGPQTRELAAFRSALRATYGDMPATIAVRQLAEPPSPPARYDEFGVPSLAKEWVPVGLAHAVYRADGRDPHAQQVLRLAPGEAAPAGATVIEIDIR